MVMSGFDAIEMTRFATSGSIGMLVAFDFIQSPNGPAGSGARSTSSAMGSLGQNQLGEDFGLPDAERAEHTADVRDIARVEVRSDRHRRDRDRPGVAVPRQLVPERAGDHV